MAGTAGSTIELRTGGNDGNGGAFNPASAGTDYSQQASPQLSVTDGVANGTTTITSATGGFTAAMIGNYINIAGTCYEITARASTNSITVDRTVSTASGLTMKVGGAVASPGMVGKIVSDCTIASWQVWQQAGTYTIASTSSNVATGIFSITQAGTATAAARWRGYNTTRGDINIGALLTRPVITFAAINTATAAMTLMGNNTLLENVDFLEGSNASSASKALSVVGTDCRVINCKASGFQGTAVVISGGRSVVEFCELTASASAGGALVLSVASARAVNCYSHDNTGPGFQSTVAGAMFESCIADTCTGASTDGFNLGGVTTLLKNCVAYACGRAGFDLASSNASTLINCYSSGNTGAGYRTSAATPLARLINCGGYNNSTNYDNTQLLDSGNDKVVFNFQALSAAGMVDAANGDFTLNNNSGGGALLRGAGWPSAFPGLSMTGYPNIGVAQHQATGGAPGFASPLIRAAKG